MTYTEYQDVSKTFGNKVPVLNSYDAISNRKSSFLMYDKIIGYNLGDFDTVVVVEDRLGDLYEVDLTIDGKHVYLTGNKVKLEAGSIVYSD